MRSHLWVRFLWLAWITSCSQVNSSQVQSVPLQDLPGDVPSRGRSLFDQVTIQDDGGFMQQRLAYPLPELRKQLEAHMQSPLSATLIPRGRSLQRHATDQPFRYPRVVLAATAAAKAAPNELGFQLKDRLYIGYVESTNQLEVISYNPDLSRFEFQVVEDFGPGLTPKVRYANREFCTACHQNQAPIFSEPSWDETAANPNIQAKLLATIGKNEYLGIPILQLRSVPNAIDDSTDRANLLLPLQKLWAQGCDTGEPQPSRECRRLSVQLALEFKIFGSFNYSLYEEVKPLYQRAWALHFPQGLAIPQNNIPNFNPLQDFTSGRNTPLLDQLGLNVKAALAQLAADSNIPAAAEPLTPRLVPREVWTLAQDDAARLIYAIGDELTAADVTWLKQLMPSTDSVGEMLAKLDATYDEATFVRCELLAALARVANAAALGCDNRAFKSMPQALATGALASDSRRDARLILLDQYCAGCHGSGPLNFLEGPASEVIERLRIGGIDHLRRLDWESGAAASMPPPKSAARRALEDKPEDRRAIQDFLRELTDRP